MLNRKFTVVTQLHDRNNSGLIEYIESSRREYGKALRERLSMQSSVAVSISQSTIVIYSLNMELLVELPTLLSLTLKDASML